MSEKKYIEANDLMKQLPNEPYKGEIRRVLQQAPAADVVEVVRCRDCREYTPVEGGKPLCALHSIGVAYDDFCSYAERRSE